MGEAAERDYHVGGAAGEAGGEALKEEGAAVDGVLACAARGALSG